MITSATFEDIGISKVKGPEMDIRTRMILVNAGIAAGLLVMFYRGTGMLPLAIAGISLFSFANVLMVRRKRQSES